MSELGYATHIQTVAVPGGTSRNLVADRPGDGEDRELVLVTAHLDSVNTQGPGAAPPGADDNASGSAGVLAIGQALAGRSTRHDLRLILFGGEEQGLFGSRHYVNGLDADERGRISAVVNMDMIACQNTGTAAVLLEGAPVSQAMIDALADITQANTSLAVQTSLEPFNSDHAPIAQRLGCLQNDCREGPYRGQGGGIGPRPDVPGSQSDQVPGAGLAVLPSIPITSSAPKPLELSRVRVRSSVAVEHIVAGPIHLSMSSDVAWRTPVRWNLAFRKTLREGPGRRPGEFSEG